MFMLMMYYTVGGSICGKWHAQMVNVGMQMLCSQLGNRGKKWFLHKALMLVSKLFQLLNMHSRHLLH